VASIVAAGLLLYGGPGFIQALGVVLAILLGALGAGVATGHAGRTDDPVEALRRRWLLTLLAFTLAAGFSAGWEAFRGFGALPLTQGVGLALLGGFPLFAGGAVLGFLGRPEDLPGGIRGPAVPALAGGAAGALLLGFVLFPALSPTGTLLSCLVTLSIAALVQGRVLDEVTWVRGREELGRRGGAGGRRVVVPRSAPAPPARLVRGAAPPDGGPRGRRFGQAARPGPPRGDLPLGEVGRAGVGTRRRHGAPPALGRHGIRTALRRRGDELVLVDEADVLLEGVETHFLKGGDLRRTIEVRRKSVREVLVGSPAHLSPGAGT
jgi:hypothetical protein